MQELSVADVQAYRQWLLFIRDKRIRLEQNTNKHVRAPCGP